MATRARSASTDFFDAATKVLDDQARAEKKLREELRKTHAAQARFEREHARKLHNAFADYRKNLGPLLEAVEGLPARNGEKFMVRVDQNLITDWASKEEKRSMNIWIAYAKPVVSAADHAKIKTTQLPMPAKGVSDGLDAYPAANGRGIISISLDHDPLTGERVRVGSHPYSNTLKSIDDIPAYIGKWMAEEAPERLNDLKKALGVKPARKAASPGP